MTVTCSYLYIILSSILILVENINGFIFPTQQHFINGYKMTWIEAETYCLSTYDSHLISIHDPFTFSQIRAEIHTMNQKAESFWIGLENVNPYNSTPKYEWKDDTPFDFGSNINGGQFPWFEERPEKPDIYTKVRLWGGGGEFLWDDQDQNSRYFWICNDNPSANNTSHNNNPTTTSSSSSYASLSTQNNLNQNNTIYSNQDDDVQLTPTSDDDKKLFQQKQTHPVTLYIIVSLLCLSCLIVLWLTHLYRMKNLEVNIWKRSVSDKYKFKNTQNQNIAVHDFNHNQMGIKKVYDFDFNHNQMGGNGMNNNKQVYDPSPAIHRDQEDHHHYHEKQIIANYVDHTHTKDISDGMTQSNAFNLATPPKLSQLTNPTASATFTISPPFTNTTISATPISPTGAMHVKSLNSVTNKQQTQSQTVTISPTPTMPSHQYKVPENYDPSIADSHQFDKFSAYNDYTKPAKKKNSFFTLNKRVLSSQLSATSMQNYLYNNDSMINDVIDEEQSVTETYHNRRLENLKNGVFLPSQHYTETEAISELPTEELVEEITGTEMETTADKQSIDGFKVIGAVRHNSPSLAVYNGGKTIPKYIMDSSKVAPKTTMNTNQSVLSSIQSTASCDDEERMSLRDADDLQFNGDLYQKFNAVLRVNGGGGQRKGTPKPGLEISIDEEGKVEVIMDETYQSDGEDHHDHLFSSNVTEEYE